MQIHLAGIVFGAALLAGLAAPAAAQESFDFRRLDRNRDGRVSWSEYRRDGRADRTGRFQRHSRTDRSGRFERRDERDRHDGRRGENPRERERRLRAEFRWLDRNGDGWISRREARIAAEWHRKHDRRSHGHERGSRS